MLCHQHKAMSQKRPRDVEDVDSSAPLSLHSEVHAPRDGKSTAFPPDASKGILLSQSEYDSLTREKDLRLELEEKLNALREVINAQNTEYDPLASCLYGEIELRQHHEGRCVGREGLCRQVLVVARNVRQRAGLLDNQNAVALGHSAASGSGKTFWTECFRQVALTVKRSMDWAENFEPLSCYIGFNSQFTATTCEQTWVSKSADPEIAIRTVVFSRLLVALTAMFPNKASVLDLSRFDVDGSDCQKLPFVPRFDSSGSESDLGKINLCSIDRKVEELLRDCNVDGKVLVLLIAVDEAQLLDAWAKGGSRFALRCLRQLQVKVVNATGGGVILIPTATGINQYEHELVQSFGSVEFISEVYLSRPNHETVTARIVRSSISDATEEQIKSIAAIFYPSVRTIATAFQTLSASSSPDFDVAWNTSVVDSTDTRFSGESLKELTRCLVLHAYCGEPLQRSELIEASYVPLIRTKIGEIIPVLPFTWWKWIGSGLRLDRAVFADNQTISAPMTRYELKRVDAPVFEIGTFLTVGYFMHWFAPLLATTEISNKRATDALLQWLPSIPFQLVRVVRPPEQVSKSQYLPFNCYGSHAESQKSGGLCDSFVLPFSALNDGEGFWYVCEGSAPIDFILVIKFSSQIVLRYMDAMHRSKDAHTRSDSKNKGELGNIRAKARALHDAVSAKLTNVAPFAEEHATVFTNDPTFELAVSPSNFTWEPWTTLLYFMA